MNSEKSEKMVSPSVFIDLKMALNSPQNTYSYAFTRIYSPINQKVKVLVGVDDGLTMWINQKKVYENNGKFIWFSDEDAVDVCLMQGWNVLLLKIFYDKDNSYGFTIRFADSSGEIVDNIGYKASDS